MVKSYENSSFKDYLQNRYTISSVVKLCLFQIILRKNEVLFAQDPKIHLTAITLERFLCLILNMQNFESIIIWKMNIFKPAVHNSKNVLVHIPRNVGMLIKFLQQCIAVVYKISTQQIMFDRNLLNFGRTDTFQTFMKMVVKQRVLVSSL